MDIAYAVQQLDREMAILEAQLHEKKITRKALYGTLNPTDKTAVDQAQAKLVAQFSGKPAPPPPIGT